MLCRRVLLALLVGVLVTACTPSATDAPPASEDGAVPENEVPSDQDVAPTERPPTASGPALPRQSDPAALIQPEDLTYLGAFRLPDDAPEDIGWWWGGAALAYYPDGDPDGPDDGYPGSLFGTGHDWNQYVSEVSIPAPVNSPSKNPGDLPVAETLQPFTNIRGNLFPHLDFEIPRAGLEYLPPQGEQTTGKLYFCWGQHYQEELNVTHGWIDTDLTSKPAGAWFIGDYQNYSTDDYLFAIDPQWAEQHTPGMLLATGRYRDGGWSGQGPSLFAIGPWNEGNPPPPGTHLAAVPLLLYDTTYEPGGPAMDNYHNSDEWNGGAWLRWEDRSAVIFVGTKGTGENWYGFANGVVWPDQAPYPEIPDPPNDDRGWWSTGFVGQILFYDPAQFAAVAAGQMEPYEPQPYATLNVDEVLFDVTGPQEKYHVGAAAYDRQRQILYVLELFGDGDKPLVHAWQIGE